MFEFFPFVKTEVHLFILINHNPQTNLCSFQYKLGINDWETNLKHAKELDGQLKSRSERMDVFASLPKPLVDFLKKIEGSEDEDKNTVVPEDQSDEDPVFAKVWKSSESEEKKRLVQQNRKARDEVVPEIEVKMSKLGLASKLQEKESRNVKKGGVKAELLSETDEPMTPVADLVGKFLSLSRQGL